MGHPDSLSDIDVVAHTVYGEARNQGQAGQAAVAWVIKNRAARGLSYMGTTEREVCLKPYQFSCWDQEDVNRKILLSLNTNDETYRSIYQIVEKVLSGKRPDNTHGSTHYHATTATYSQRSWADGKTPVVRIGDHHFYNTIV
jgi:spore germination cell wall hydrolase CwlJ-like protein